MAVYGVAKFCAAIWGMTAQNRPDIAKFVSRAGGIIRHEWMAEDTKDSFPRGIDVLVMVRDGFMVRGDGQKLYNRACGLADYLKMPRVKWDENYGIFQERLLMTGVVNSKPAAYSPPPVLTQPKSDQQQHNGYGLPGDLKSALDLVAESMKVHQVFNGADFVVEDDGTVWVQLRARKLRLEEIPEWVAPSEPPNVAEPNPKVASSLVGPVKLVGDHDPTDRSIVDPTLPKRLKKGQRRTKTVLKATRSELIAFFKEHPGTRLGMAAESLKCERTRLTPIARELVQEEILRKKGIKRGTKYWVKK